MSTPLGTNTDNDRINSSSDSEPEDAPGNVKPTLKRLHQTIKDAGPEKRTKLFHLEKTITDELSMLRESRRQEKRVTGFHTRSALGVKEESVNTAGTAAKAVSSEDVQGDLDVHGVQQKKENVLQKAITESGDGTTVEKCIYEERRANNEDEVYCMESGTRGLALIISNTHFDNAKYNRLESKVHSENLQQLFNALGFEVDVYDDQNGEAMMAVVDTASRNLQFRNFDSLVVVILTHGGHDGVLFGTDMDVVEGDPKQGTFITVEYLRHIFGGTGCPAMKNKPKLFILQACRGGYVDTREGPKTYVKADPCPDANDDNGGKSDGLETCIKRGSTNANLADMLFFYPSVECYVAHREFFIPCIVDTFWKFAHLKHLTEIHAEINAHLASIETEDKAFTISVAETTLTRSWYLNPPPTFYAEKGPGSSVEVYLTKDEKVSIASGSRVQDPESSSVEVYLTKDEKVSIASGSAVQDQAKKV